MAEAREAVGAVVLGVCLWRDVAGSVVVVLRPAAQAHPSLYSLSLAERYPLALSPLVFSQSSASIESFFLTCFWTAGYFP